MVGIFSFLSLRYAQFAYKYTNILDENNIEYELIVWNRDSLSKPNRNNWIYYDYQLNSFQPFVKKIIGFLKFSLYMRKMIKNHKYDKLIILTTQTAIPLYDILLKKYKGKYIYDYRDVTYENIHLYLRMVNKLIHNSSFTAISSMGFKENLKESNKFLMSHNTRDFNIKSINTTFHKSIRIVYWGMVRQLDFNKRICDLFGNDSRFELIYHGAGYHCELKEYCKSKNYENISITGEYSLSEIENFASHTDIVLNCYGNDKKQTLAMTVKYYDAISFKKPMIVTEDSYMAKLVERNKLGFIISVDDESILDRLYNDYMQFDFNAFEDNCRKEYIRIKKDDKVFEQELINFCEK